MFEWLLLLFTPVLPDATPKKDYIGLVAAEAAYASMLSDTPVKKPLVDTKDCKRCKGTGRIRTGDDINWTDCPDCEPKEGSPVTSGSTPPAPSMKLQIKPLPPVKNSNCPDGNCPLRRA